jgi:succinate dehydrogenase hydrophobic anchor subunit
MEILTITFLILFIILIIGLLIYAYNIVPENDYDQFWASKYRFLVLVFYPIIILTGWLNIFQMPPDFYNNFNKRRVIETIICTFIGILGTIIIYLIIS